MVKSTERCVFGLLLLFLTCSGCASRTPSSLEPAAGAQSAPEPSDADRAAFAKRGIEAPETAFDVATDTAKFDPAAIADAFGQAQEASPELLARLQRRGGEESDFGETEDAESEVATTGARPRPNRPTEERPPAPPAVMPSGGDGRDRGDSNRPAAEPDPAPGASLDFKLAEAEGSIADESVEELRRRAQVDTPLAKEKEKKGGKNGDVGQDAVRTLLPVVSEPPRLGKILIRNEAGALVAITPRAIRVVAYVQGPRARTVVDYVFENPHDRRLEGTFYYPLPADAAPAGFAMFDGAARVEGERFFQSQRLLPALGEGFVDPLAMSAAAPAGTKGSIDWKARKDARVVEQKRARQVYEDIVRQEIDPALLEWSGGHNFQARVFPLEPKSLKRLVVAYEQPLLFDGTQHRYRYAMPGDATLVEREATIFVDSAHGTVTQGPAGAAPKKLGRWQRFDVRASPGQELAVAVRPNAEAAVLRGRDESGLPGETFYAELRPALQERADRPTQRAMLWVDSSLSSEEGGAHARRARMIEALLEGDETIERYAVMLFDVRPRWLHRVGWIDNTPANRARTIAELRRVYLEGATNFAAALQELNRQRAWAVEGGSTTAFLLSDGEITWGLDRVEALPARHPVLREVRWISYRFGEAPANQALFDVLSGETAGRTVTVVSEAEATAAARAHRAAAFELKDVRVEGAASADVVVASDPRLLFPGQVLRVAGRLPKGGDAKLVVSIASGGQTQALEIPLSPRSDGDRFAPRAWAELQTRRLTAMDDPRLDRMIVALSQHYRLANARASFLVLENERQVEQYNLRDEQVDLRDLITLRQQELDSRRDQALGIGLDEVSAVGREVVAILARRADGFEPALRPQPLLESPFSGGAERLHEEASYREARAKEPLDYLMYERIARARALAGDTAGAVRALSCAVELRPRDAEAMRLVGYALLAVAQYEVAAELFERIRLLRPFEPQSYLEEAYALDALGRVDEAARNFEIILSKSWPRHDSEAKATAAVHYARTLADVIARGKLPKAERTKLLERRVMLASEYATFGGVERVDFQLTTHWSTDSVDIDLWVFEPNGEKCDYTHLETSLGGHLYWDVTNGLGPELYQARNASPGTYDTLVHFYGSGAPRLAAPTALLMVVDRNPHGAPSSRRFLMRMLPKKDAVLMLRTEHFEAR